MTVLLSFDEDFHVRLLPPATASIRWQIASHRRCKFSQEGSCHVTRTSWLVATRSDSSLNAGKERLGLGHERRGSQRSNFASFHPQNSSKGLDRSETPCTRDSVQLLPTRRRFELHCKCDEMRAAASTAIANQVHDPTKTSLIVSEVDKGSLKGFQPWETLPRPFRMAVSKNVTQICG